MTPLQRSTQLTAQWSLLLIFPGFFVYHSLVAQGYIPAVFGGYSTLVAAAALPFLGAAYLRNALGNYWFVNPTDLGLLVFLAYYLLVVIFNDALNNSGGRVAPHLGIMLQFAAIFLTFKLADLDDPRLLRWIWFSFTALTTIIFANISDGAFVIAALDLEQTDDKLADYQGYAFVYLMIFLICASRARTAPARAILYLTGIPALFLNGARSEFFCAALAVLIIEFLRSRRRLIVALAVMLIASAMVLVASQLADLFPDNRVASLLAGYATDESRLDRQRMMQRALAALSDHFFLGSYASYPPGEYAHNLLSAWVDLGLIGFLLYLGLLTAPLNLLWRGFRRQSRHPHYMLLLTTFVTAAILYASAKYFTHQLLPVLVGLYGRELAARRLRRVHGAVITSRQALV